MYKRPGLKTRSVPRAFVTEVRSNGTRTSSWVRVEPKPVIWTGQEGRVGEIVTAMHRGDNATRPDRQPWKPSYDYEFIAKFMPVEERAAYIAASKAWIDENPFPTPSDRVKVEYDRELVQALFAKYPGKVPPFQERIKVYRVAGHSEAYIQRAIARHERLEAMADERQKVLDGLFGKWPSASKPTKTAPKVIKAVKKKIT